MTPSRRTTRITLDLAASRRRRSIRKASPSSDPKHSPHWPTVLTALTALVGAVAASVAVWVSRSANDQTIRLTEQGQITQRYTAAIDQIGQRGDDYLQTRLGGIYAFERLARDSPDDQPTIVEVLSAFIRTTAPTRTNGTCVGQPEHPSPDVQAALTVLGRRNPAADGLAIVDLNNTCLGGARIGWTRAPTNFVGADLTAVDLTGADVGRSNFSKADFSAANLGGARFQDVSFVEARFVAGCDLRNATFVNSVVAAQFEGASFETARIDPDTWGALIFYRANLKGAERSEPVP